MCTPPRAVHSRVRLVLVVLALVLAAACGSTAPERPPAAPSGSAPPAAGPLAQRLAEELTEAEAFVHLEALQRIADEHGGNRASPSPGYDASVDYVVEVLRGAGFDVATPTYQVSGEDDDGGVMLRNVVAQTGTGDPESVVMIGAHLDSVQDGPGIVDNGSGVATLLAIANALGASPPVQNAVRFAFFGSEEQGAVGSTAYVDDLSASDRRRILLYLNVDMVASPNGGYIVQGGKGEDESESGPPGSARIGHVLASELSRTGVVAPELAEFVGDDEAPFVEAGIPSGGAENGDSAEKSEDQARSWGGRAGEAFDVCFHEACDTLDNVNRVVLDHYLHALAGTLAHFATSTEELTG